MSEFSLIYQAPLLLTRKQSKLTEETSFRYEKKVETYTYNPETKNYDVKGVVVRAQNNQSQYTLLQFHCHQTAEFQFVERKNQPYALEFHFVFQEATGSGNLLVLAQLFKLSDVSSAIIPNIISGRKITIPQVCATWNLPGSLTDLPGPNEHTIEWVISDQILCVSQEDLDVLKFNSKAARPLQPREGRDIIFVQPRKPSTLPEKSHFDLCGC